MLKSHEKKENKNVPEARFSWQQNFPPLFFLILILLQEHYHGLSFHLTVKYQKSAWGQSALSVLGGGLPLSPCKSERGSHEDGVVVELVMGLQRPLGKDAPWV